MAYYRINIINNTKKIIIYQYKITFKSINYVENKYAVVYPIKQNHGLIGLFRFNFVIPI